MLKGILTVGVWTLVSRVLGFLRDMLIAASLGAGPIADAFFIALKLPNLFRRLFGEGAFNAAFVPTFAATLTLNGAAQARALAERMSTLMTMWLTLLTALGLVFMPQLLHVLAPGFVDEPIRFQFAIELTRITFPYLIFICLTALISGVLNGLDRFAAAAGAPVLFNLLSMASLFALTPFVATPGHALAWGVTASGAAQLLLVWVAAARAGMPLRLISLPRLTPEVQDVLRRMGPGLIGAGVTQLNLAVDMVIASLLPAGAISYLYYADRIGQLPLGVIGAAVGTAMLPLLAKQLRGGKPLSAHRTMNRALELSLALALPAAAAQAVLAWPIISALFMRGAFGELEAIATSAALTVYALGLPAFILVKAYVPGFFARGDTATPVKVGLCIVAVNLALNLVLTRYLAHVGIALATSLSAWINVAVLAWLLRHRGQWRPDRRLRRRLPRLLMATLAMAVVLLAMRAAIPDPVGSTARLVVLAAYVVVGLITYFGIAQAIGGLHISEIRRRR
ncbi:murein biosynthesis integral membrane protein MurJ [Roseomonas xinghualingensis]|uniref:murein biosynthesis integral membrane protein MurJ n=1 Tax=Roseomonas xinghualingensis TaxID=2986475 RepID=UPI0021F1BE09|nr:murein biosynthesis integral membrane protein MurJ [Roseomonas sp. SXEYE001]MCV4208481.1 murein biosynthesis integral membrane protein MurJ [Roseomonas sp. SXEYE001]